MSRRDRGYAMARDGVAHTSGRSSVAIEGWDGAFCSSPRIMTAPSTTACVRVATSCSYCKSSESRYGGVPSAEGQGRIPLAHSPTDPFAFRARSCSLSSPAGHAVWNHRHAPLARPDLCICQSLARIARPLLAAHPGPVILHERPVCRGYSWKTPRARARNIIAQAQTQSTPGHQPPETSTWNHATLPITLRAQDRASRRPASGARDLRASQEMLLNNSRADSNSSISSNSNQRRGRVFLGCVRIYGVFAARLTRSVVGASSGRCLSMTACSSPR